MSKTEHTPGPWELLCGTVQLSITGPQGVIARMPRVSYETDKPIASPEEVANARLIKESPTAHELLAALHLRAEYGDWHFDFDTLYDDTRTWAEAIADYLKAVEGSKS